MEIFINIIVVAIAVFIDLFVISKRSIEEARNKSRDFEKISDNKDIIALMFDNAKELKEYYIISKNQAKSTFRIAIFSCILGFIIYVGGICAFVFAEKDVTVISVISGTVLEIVSGTTFWLYNKTLTQLNTYHRRLDETEKYLIAYQMIGEVAEEKRYEEQRNFVNYVLNNAQFRVKSDCGVVECK